MMGEPARNASAIPTEMLMAQVKADFAPFWLFYPHVSAVCIW
jgi:hypothetical protein